MTGPVQAAIAARRSQPVLVAPAPDDAVLARAFEAAARAPDHRVLRPWRYVVLTGEQRVALGQVFWQDIHHQDPERAAREATRLQQLPLRAPMLIAAVLSSQNHPGVPLWEQWLSLGAGIQNLLLALHEEGFGAMWRTGEMVEAVGVRRWLGLTEAEQIGGFIYVGQAAGEKAAPPLPTELWRHHR